MKKVLVLIGEVKKAQHRRGGQFSMIMRNVKEMINQDKVYRESIICTLI